MDPQRKSNFEESKQNFLKNKSVTVIGQQNFPGKYGMPNTARKIPEIAMPNLNFIEKNMGSPKLRENNIELRKTESGKFKVAPTKNFFLKDNFFDGKQIIRVDQPVKFKIPSKGTTTIFEKKVASVESQSLTSVQDVGDKN